MSYSVLGAGASITTEPKKLVSTANSTTTVLGISGVFTGTAEDVSDYSQLTVFVATDVSSATDGLQMQLSTDGTNWDRSKNVTTSGGVHTLVIVSQYFRIVYTNGTTPQTYFRLQAIYHSSKNKHLTSTIEQTLTTETDVEMMRAVITAKNASGAYGNITSDDNNRLLTNSGDTTTLGEQKVVRYTPVVQAYAPYGMINDQIYKTFLTVGGTITASSNASELDLKTTTSVGSSAVLRAKRVIKFRPGMVNIAKIDYLFDTPVATSLQFCGVGSAGADLYFAYNGTDFGIRHSTDGVLHVVTLTLSAAETAAETITINLNSVEFTVSATNAGGSIPFTAHEIVVGTTWTGWEVEQIGNDVLFMATSVGARSGTYSISSTGAAAGSFATTKTGVALTTTNVTQANWNGSSDMVTDLNPLLENSYEIEYAWEMGNYVYRVLNPSTGFYEIVHTVQHANTTTTPLIAQPNMFMQCGVASLGSTTALTCVTSAQFAGVMGAKVARVPRWGVTATKALSGETVMCVIKNRNTINGNANQSEMKLTRMSVAADGNQPVTVKVVKNPATISADSTTNFISYSYIDENYALGLFDTTADTYTGGEILEDFVVGKNLAILVDTDIELEQNDIVIVTCTSGAANTPVVAISMIDDL